MIAVVIPTHNRREALLRCLQSVYRATDVVLVAYVVDDGSQDGTEDAVRHHFPQARLLKGDGSLWWTGSMNLGSRAAVQDGAGWILVLNDDTEISPDGPAHLLRRSEAEPDAIIGSKILNRGTGRLWCTGGFERWPWPGLVMRGYGEPDRGRYDVVTEVRWLPGMGTLVRAEHMERLGYYDAVNLPQAYADADLTFRARKMKLRVLYEPASRILNDTTTTALDVRNIKTLGGFLRALTDRRARLNVSPTVHFYARHCPTYWLPIALILLYVRYALSWVRHGLLAPR
jgi:GT2 family glycosyltransferase